MKWSKSHLFAENGSLVRYRNSRGLAISIETLSCMGPLSADEVDPLDEKQNRREKQPCHAPHPARLTDPPRYGNVPRTASVSRGVASRDSLCFTLPSTAYRPPPVLGRFIFLVRGRHRWS